MFSLFGSKKKQQNIKEKQDQSTTSSLPTVMLLSKEPFSVDNERLFKMLCNRYKKADGTEPSVTINPVGASVAGIQIIILSSEKPLPPGWKDLATPSHTPHWPEALDVLSQHKSHMILSVAGQPDRLRGMRVLTAVAGAIIELYPDHVLAGLWNALILQSAQTWRIFSIQSFAPSPPSDLWVSQHPFRDENTGAIGVRTIGLALFVDRELELVSPGNDLASLLDRSRGLTSYLVQNGSVLAHGSTFGISESERIVVSLQNSSRFPGVPVIAATVQ